MEFAARKTAVAMQVLSLSVLIVAIVFSSGCQVAPPSNDPADIAALQGTWRVVAIEIDLQPVPDAEIQRKNIVYAFKGNELTIRHNGHEETVCPYTVDNSTDPKRMTVTRQDIRDRAAYAISGDRLRIAIIVDANPRSVYPNEIVGGLAPKTDLFTLERVRENPAP